MKADQPTLFRRAAIALIFAALNPVLAARSAPSKTPQASAAATNAAPQVIPKSVFIIPDTPNEGRDPFFPDSTRVYSTSQPRATKPANVVTLILNGLSGTPDHRLAMINGRTMAEGEEAEISGATGVYHVRCVSIQDDSVIIDVDGQRRELRMRTN